jgi:hypothetical protein
VSHGQSAAAGGAPPAEHGATTVELEIPAHRRFHAVGRLVTGGLATRAGLDVDELDDLRLAVETILQQPPAQDALSLSITESGKALELTVGPFASKGERAALEWALSGLVDDFLVRESEHGKWLAVSVSPRQGTRGSR